MKKLLIPGFSFISSIIITVSCNTPRYIYSPSAQNVPVLTKKGDSKIGGVYSTNFSGQQTREGEPIDNKGRGFDLQGAVAITDHFAVQANYFYRWEKTAGGVDSFTARYNRYLMEFGLGYYLPLSDKKNVIFQFFGGGGWGRFSFTDTGKLGNYYHQANISKIYLQPAFLFRSKGSFTSSVSLRTSIINYSKIKTNYNNIQLSDFYLTGLNNGSRVFFEPAYTGSFGFKDVPGIRFEFQAGLSFLVSRTYYDYRIFNFSVGTWVDIGSVFNKNKP